MAVIPQASGVAPSGAGAIPAPARPYQQAGEAGTPGGQGAAAGAARMQLGQALGQFGQQIGNAADIAAREALREQAMSNEAMARDADSEAAIGMSNIYNEYSTMEGEKAVGAKDGFMARMQDARKAALDLMPNPQARRMLDSVVTRRVGFYQEAIGRYAAGEQKKWQARSATGAAAVATDQAAVFRNDPALLDRLVESGVGNVLALGEIQGWDADTQSAKVAAYKGDAYTKVIQQMLGDNNVDGAVATFERVKDGLDAASQAQISQMLLPKRRQQQTQMDYASAMGTGPGTATTIADAIMMQESGGRDGLVSVDGARGKFQIMPGTFAQFAQPGESIDVAADNAAVGRRIIDSYSQKWGGDPARVAVAYFSGPGNVSEPGSPKPWKEDRRDGNGMSVSRYVSQVTGRLRTSTEGAPEYQRPDFAAARERAMDIAGDDPDRLQRLLSRVNQGEAQYNSTTKAERDTLTARLNDTQAALADGRAVAIPETDIRRLYPREQADEIVGKLTEVRQQGYAYQAVQFASPAERAALLASYDDVGKAPSGTDAEVQAGYAQRAKSRAATVAAIQRVDEQIKKDPAAYALQSPAVAAYAAADALGRPGGQEAYARATLGEQERLGVPEAERRVLPKAQIASLVQQITQADPEKVPAALVLDQIGQKFGDAWPAVFRDMVRGGLPKPYAILGSMSHPDQVGARGDAQRMLAVMSDEKRGGMSALRANVVDGAVSAKSIDDGLDAALAQFQETSRFMTGGTDLYATTREFVKGMAYYYAGQGASPNKALAQAVGGVLNAKYDFDGSMRVPKGMLGLAKEVTSDIQAQLGAAALAAVPEGPMAETQRARLVTAAQNGFWVPNADDTGLVLMAQYRNGPAGIPVYEPVRGADGAQVSVRFDHMDALRNTATTRNTERRGALPARPPIDALGNPVLVAPR